MEKKNIEVNPEFIPEMFKFALRLVESYHLDKETQQLADNLLNVAKEDLESCNLLYIKGKYAQSTYFLQQATEKATKTPRPGLRIHNVLWTLGRYAHACMQTVMHT